LIEAKSLGELPDDLQSILGITQAGGWKSTRMPLRYAERIAARRQESPLHAAAELVY
jgi:hypothetical protein